MRYLNFRAQREKDFGKPLDKFAKTSEVSEAIGLGASTVRDVLLRLYRVGDAEPYEAQHLDGLRYQRGWNRSLGYADFGMTSGWKPHGRERQYICHRQMYCLFLFASNLVVLPLRGLALPGCCLSYGNLSIYCSIHILEHVEDDMFDRGFLFQELPHRTYGYLGCQSVREMVHASGNAAEGDAFQAVFCCQCEAVLVAGD